MATTEAKTAKKGDSEAKKAPKAEDSARSKPFAVIATGGKQYIVAEGQELKVEKLTDVEKVGDQVTFDKVLLTDDGKETVVGTPYIDGAKVTAELKENGKNKKVVVIKYKAKSRYFKKRGHRQPYSKVAIKLLK